MLWANSGLAEKGNLLRLLSISAFTRSRVISIKKRKDNDVLLSSQSPPAKVLPLPISGRKIIGSFSLRRVSLCPLQIICSIQMLFPTMRLQVIMEAEEHLTGIPQGSAYSSIEIVYTIGSIKLEPLLAQEWNIVLLSLLLC